MRGGAFAVVRWVCALALWAGCGGPRMMTTFDAGAAQPPAQATSTLTVDRTDGVVADGRQGVLATVTLRDASGGMPYASEVWFSLAGADAGVAPSGPGNKVDQVLVSTQLGPKVVSAEVRFDAGSFVLQAAMPVTFVPGPAHGLHFVQQPSAVQAGAVMAPAVRLQLRDATGHDVTGPPKTVRLRLVNSVSGAVLTGGDYRASADGGLVFDGLVIDLPQTRYNLRAEEQGMGLAAESAPFDVSP